MLSAILSISFTDRLLYRIHSLMLSMIEVYKPWIDIVQFFNYLILNITILIMEYVYTISFARLSSNTHIIINLNYPPTGIVLSGLSINSSIRYHTIVLFNVFSEKC